MERDRRVIVRAPLGAREGKIAEVVEKKRFWIWQKLRDPHKYQATPHRKEFVAGESFLFLGQSFPLRLVGDAAAEFGFNGRQFELASFARSRGLSLFRNWYLAEAKTHLVPRVAALAKSLGVNYRRISVRDLK